MVKITKCPPGEALGARDLQNWSRGRLQGSSYTNGPSYFKFQTILVHCRNCTNQVEMQVTKEQRERMRFKCSRCRSTDVIVSKVLPGA